MTNYSKMTKADLIDIIKNIDSRLSYERSMYEMLGEINTALEAENIKLRNSPPTYRPGWWLGVALFAAILIPWILFGIWVMS